MWNIHSVLNVLYSLVAKSNIKEQVSLVIQWFRQHADRLFSPLLSPQLEVVQAGGDPDSVAGEFGSHPLYKNIGYFSLIGLLRLHTQLGDYHTALESVANIQLSKKVSNTGHSLLFSCLLLVLLLSSFIFSVSSFFHPIFSLVHLHRCWPLQGCQLA